jgi:hypothetical protein
MSSPRRRCRSCGGESPKATPEIDPNHIFLRRGAISSLYANTPGTQDGHIAGVIAL